MTRFLVEGDGATHKEIAKELGISHQRVAQIEARAVLRLRRCFMLIGEGVPVNDAIRITNAKGYGIIIDGDGVKLIAGSSGMLLGPDGSSLKSGGRMAVDGTTITLGNPLPTPMSAALKGISGTMSSPSTKVLIE